MSKKVLIPVIVLVLLGVIGLVWMKNRNNTPVAVTEEEVELPVNTIPVEERPFITLTPDASGRNLSFYVNGAPKSGEMEYELIYNAGTVQEGVFGRLNLDAESQPVTKELLLGSKSGGGKVTYHEGITGGSMTVTYGEIKLKEQFNFLRFDPADPSLSASDLRFTATMPKTAFKKDAVVVIMKSFGLPAPVTGKLVSGPYALLTSGPIKGNTEIEMKLPAGDFTEPTINVYDGSKWVPIKTALEGQDTLKATVTSGSIFTILSK